MARVIGIDGWPGGWVGVVADDATVERVVAGATLAGLLEAAGDVAAVGIDVPIGWDGGPTRAVDDAMRAFVGPRRSSVFACPHPDALAAPTYAEANALQRTRTGRGLSKQAWNLGPRITEAAGAVATGYDLHEIFPEASFAAMAGAPLAHPKTTWAGAEHRRSLLAERGLLPGPDLGPAGRVPPADVLDAAAVAWSAARVAAGTARCLPDDPPVDDAGRLVCAWV